MRNSVYSYLEKDYKYLLNYITEIDKVIFISPYESIVKARIYAERITCEILKLEGYGLMISENQYNRLNILKDKGVFTPEIESYFHKVRLSGNKAAHDNIEGELEIALMIDRSLYKITCWFVTTYIDHSFKEEPYKSPIPNQNQNINIDLSSIKEIMKKTVEEVILDKKDKKIEIIDKNREDAYLDLVVRDIVDSKEPDKKCLVQQLERLKESSKEAVESINEFTNFKKYMHVERKVQSSLENLIIQANESNKAQLILVCGSVGDGKSHIISYFKDKYSEIMQKFKLHNDATESLEPNKTSMDTLNEVLDNFCDNKIENSNEKIILAINLGTLTNFIDSKYGQRFTKLKKFVIDKKILENVIEDEDFDDKSNFQFINFSDYHIFTLENGKVKSDYIEQIINRITQPYINDGVEKNNYFYNSYKRNCLNCSEKNRCPIKLNYELLSQTNVKNAIVDLLVQCIVKQKIIISTRALLNFIYELIIPRSYIDVNSVTFKREIKNLNENEYINSLLPNTIFNHKELSFIFEALNKNDPLNIRNEKVDEFIINFYNQNNIINYFKKHLSYPNEFMNVLEDLDLNNTQNEKLRYQLLKLFIRSYYICGDDNLFSLRDEVYDEYINALFYFNQGNKSKLKKIYENVKKGIMNWNGEADKDYINIFVGKNQIKYKVSEKIQLKADTSNLSSNLSEELQKFIGTLILQFKSEGYNTSYSIDIDYNLYRLLKQVNQGYRPNKKDRNNFIKFVEVINKIQYLGSQDKELLITEKNQENNKQYKLEYDEEFNTYRFVER